MSVLHADQIPLSVLIGQQEQSAKVGGELTNTMVSGSTTDSALNAAVLAGPTPPNHADVLGVVTNTIKALTIGAGTGDVPSNPSTASTVAGLVADTQLNILQRPATGPMILE